MYIQLLELSVDIRNSALDFVFVFTKPFGV